MSERAAVSATAFYRDPMAALRWLEEAFGFETTLLLTDAEGKLAHSEMTFLNCGIGVAGEWAGPQLGGASMQSPVSTGGVATQFISIELKDGIDAHCEHARAAGARIVEEPADQFYGARSYRAHDLEGHVWNFRQMIRHVSNEAMTEMTGLKVATSLKEA